VHADSVAGGQELAEIDWHYAVLRPDRILSPEMRIEGSDVHPKCPCSDRNCARDQTEADQT
jgi:hypothetical protein